jgi:hypothetical protein
MVGSERMVSTTDPGDANARDQLAKYEAWTAELEQRRERIIRERSGYIRILTGILIASNVGFFWGWWVGVGTLVTGLLIFGYGWLTVMGLEWDCINEIESMRRGTELLRNVQAGQKPRNT